MDKALVSIIIPLFNSEEFIEETIQSALSQTWTPIEILIIDDGSSDNSLRIAKNYENSQIRVFSQENKGASAARNYGLLEARGEYVQFLDADDLLDPKKIEVQMEVLAEKNESIAFGRCIHFFGADGDFLQIEQEYPNINPEEESLELIKKLYGAYPDVPASMIEVHSWLTPVTVIQRAGVWNEKLSVDDDGEFFLRVLLASEKVYQVPTAVSYYRKSKSLKSLAAQILQKKGFLSSLNALNIKYELLESLFTQEETEQVFSRFYWEKALFAYPGYPLEYRYCLKKSRELNYAGPKFIGGARANGVAKVLGWKTVKYLQYIQQKYFNEVIRHKK